MYSKSFHLCCLAVTMTWSLVSLETNAAGKITDQKDLADTAALRKMFLHYDTTATAKADTTRYVTIKGMVYRERSVYWWHGKRTVLKKLALSGIPVITENKRQKTFTDEHGRFTIQVPADSLETLRINTLGGCAYDPSYYRERIPVKQIDPKRELKIKLEYWWRPWIRICPCF